MKAIAILCLMLALPCYAQSTAGEVHQLAASLPTPEMSQIIRRGDGTSVTNAPDYYIFFVSTNAAMQNPMQIGAAVSTLNPTTNYISSAKFIQPWNTTLFYAASSSNSATGSNSVLSSCVSITTKPAPVIFVQPLLPPTIWPN